VASKRAKLKGRTDREARHVRLEHWLMDTPAWLDLDTVSRCAYIEVKRRYWGTNNGQIVIGVRELGTALHVSLVTASRALKRLQDHGFIAVMQKGSFNRKVRHASEYRLTEFGCDVTNALATKDFARWQKNTVSLVKLSVAVVKPIGISGETEAGPKQVKKGLHGISDETVSDVLGISGETHIGLPGNTASPDAAVASAVASPALPASAVPQEHSAPKHQTTSNTRIKNAPSRKAA
jgi:DNA-binding transcriptional regulator YhcF (GntR family)